MHATASEITLRRVFAWLRWSGQDITPHMQQQVLRALADTLQAEAADLFGGCLERLCYQIPSPTAVPPAEIMAPPLRRGSISYGEY